MASATTFISGVSNVISIFFIPCLSKLHANPILMAVSNLSLVKTQILILACASLSMHWGTPFYSLSRHQLHQQESIPFQFYLWLLPKIHRKVFWGTKGNQKPVPNNRQEPFQGHDHMHLLQIRNLFQVFVGMISVIDRPSKKCHYLCTIFWMLAPV